MSCLYIAIWVICGIINYGFIVGHFQGEYKSLAYKDRITDRVFALMGLLSGPFGLPATFAVITRYEWRL